MSRFSEQLRTFIDDRDVKIYALAAQTGIDRTLIQKMLKGERIPSDKSMVQKLASSLLLSPTETETLIQSYQIVKMGEEVYSHRKFIKDFFNGFDKTSERSSISITTEYHHQINISPNNDATVYGKLEINNLVKTIMEMESIKKNGKIKIIAQPEYSFLFECLSIAGMNHHNLTIDHIICLENSIRSNDSLYNLNCLDVIMSMLMTGCKYNPMCYYDNVSSHFSNNNSMPYLIITSDYIVHISFDIGYATISKSKDFIYLYNRIFEDSLRKSTHLTNVLHSMIESMEYFTGVFSNFGHVNYSFSFRPGLFCFSTKEMLLKYINTSLLNKENIIETTMKYIEFLQKALELNTIQGAYFSEEGLDKFLNTGTLNEVSQEYYSPIDISDRYKLLRCMYNATLAGVFHPILVNSAVLNIPHNLSIVTSKEGIASFVYAAPNYKYTAFGFTEKSTVFAIQDFFDYLPESNMVFSPEETLTVIKQKLENEPKAENKTANGDT